MVETIVVGVIYSSCACRGGNLESVTDTPSKGLNYERSSVVVGNYSTIAIRVKMQCTKADAWSGNWYRGRMSLSTQRGASTDHLHIVEVILRDARDLDSVRVAARRKHAIQHAITHLEEVSHVECLVEAQRKIADSHDSR